MMSTSGKALLIVLVLVAALLALGFNYGMAAHHSLTFLRHVLGGHDPLSFVVVALAATAQGVIASIPRKVRIRGLHPAKGVYSFEETETEVTETDIEINS